MLIMNYQISTHQQTYLPVSVYLSVTSPMIEMNRQGGTRGMIAGVAKGIAGTVVKPTVGLLDLAEGVSTGLSNSASVFEVGEAAGTNSMRRRFRPPRPPITEGSASDTRRLVPLTLYDRSLAYAFSLLAKDETYLHHARSVFGADGEKIADSEKLAAGDTDRPVSPTMNLRGSLRDSFGGSPSSGGMRSPRTSSGQTSPALPRVSRGRESFVLITDKRILVFRDVRAADEETAQRYSSTSVADLKGLTMKDDGIELTLRMARGDSSPTPEDQAAGGRSPKSGGRGASDKGSRRGSVDEGKSTREVTRTVWLELPPSEVQAAGEQLLLVLAQNH
eukprot:COSAG05_NODE_1312_length_5217_cov_2.233685_6_plen_333_part_00